MKYFYLLLFSLLFSNLKSEIIYVTQFGSGNQDGTSWLNSFSGSNLQSAINNSQSNDQIWVACGTYLPSIISDRGDSFSMKNNLAIYGGFIGTETNLIERNLSCASCSILSGEIGNSNSLLDNSFHVISNQNLNSTAVIDGFQIINAYDDRPTTANEGLGGGIYNFGSGVGNFCNPTIVNCVFYNNHAGFGGGIFNNGFNGGNANPHIENCYFSENSAFQGGGAIDNFGLDGNASPTIVNSVFAFNSAETAGAIYCWGGGTGNSSPFIVNCTFYGNQATNGNAGAIICDNVDWNGIDFSGTSNISIKNSILWGNSATQNGPQFFIKGSANFIATYSCIDTLNQTINNPISGDNIGNIFVNPVFFNPNLVDNCLFFENDAFQLSQVSPCINKGNNLNITNKDIFGNQRLIENNVDMGAYEFVNSVCINNCAKLKDEFCDIPLTSLAQQVLCQEIVNATNYFYEVKEGDELVGVYEKGNNAQGFRLSLVSGTTLGAIYSIRIASFVGGIWSSYGIACTLSTPTYVKNKFCGTTLSNMNDFLACETAPGSVNYRYQLFDLNDNLISTYTKGSGNVGFQMGNFANVKYGTTYKIRAASTKDNITWTEYGKTCTITTPTTKLKEQSCNIALTSLNDYMSIYEVLNATNYRYELVPVGGGTTLNYERGSNSLGFRLSFVPGVEMNKTYQISVSAFVNGIWSAFGNPCAITSPNLILRNFEIDTLISEIEEHEVKISIYPNPNYGMFNITSSSESTIQISNELGQLLQIIELNNENNFNSDTDGLSSGIYYIRCTANNQFFTKIVKVH